MAKATHRDPKIDALLDRLREFDIAMFTTVAPGGHVHSRPMQTQEREPDCDLWFVSSMATHKVDELKAHPRVGVIYHRDRDHAYASLAGTARIHQDRDLIRSKWKEDWRAWFPDGPDQADLCLIKVDVEQAEWWFPEGGQLRVMFEVARAYVSGDHPELNEPERLEK